jgi:predicted Ser/Thr protein kinase
MEDILARLLDEYVARRQRGEQASPEDYRASAGPLWEEFARLLEAESSFDTALREEDGDLPREFGPYTLVRELGRGAAGVVYEARRGDRTVALKVLRQGFDTSLDLLTRFRREAEACARVRHDHVVEVYEAGEAEGRPYYAMTFLDGRSLSAIARAGGLPPARELARRVARVADALHAIHAKGVVHRDVKPGNIMADSTGRMVLADFGLARGVDAATLTRTGEALGTPRFMSPEQLLGDRAKLDGRTDVYGLGATLYELLADRPLFVATEWPELVRAILEERPKPLHEVAPDVSPDLSRIVMTAIEKRPDDRYANAAAMRDDLIAFADGRGVAGRPVSAARRGLRGLGRRWRPLAIAAGLLVAAGYAFFTFFPATLSIRTYPVAEVLLDGKSLGTTPLEASVRPGRHRLVLKSKGFRDWVKDDVSLTPLATWSVERILIADPDDTYAQEILARRYNLPTLQLAELPRTRGSSPEDWIEPLVPRGKVRAEDLTDLRIDVGPAWNAKGRLEFRAGGKVLASEDFAPGRLSTTAAMPEAAKAALKPGDAFEWGFYPENGAPRIVTCTLVSDPGRDPKMERELEGQDPSVAALLRASLLLKQGLCLAAYREASRLADEGHTGALAVMRGALEGMKLEDTPLWHDLVRRADAAGG